MSFMLRISDEKSDKSYRIMSRGVSVVVPQNTAYLRLVEKYMDNDQQC